MIGFILSQGNVYILKFPRIFNLKVRHIFRMSVYDLFSAFIAGNFHQFLIIFPGENAGVSGFGAKEGACHALMF